MSDVNIKDKLRIWRRTYGEEVTGKSHGQTYWRIPIRNRRELIITFLTEMNALGIGEEYFRKKTFESDLIDICFGTAPAFDEKKRKGGHDALREELADILATEGIFSGIRPSNDLNTKPLSKDAIQEMAKKALEQPFVSQTSAEPKTVGREVNRDLYKKVSSYEPELDEEFAALIGVKKDE